jgi:hypothetical protein
MPANTNAVNYNARSKPNAVGKHCFPTRTRYRYLRVVASSKNWRVCRAFYTEKFVEVMVFQIPTLSVEVECR